MGRDAYRKPQPWETEEGRASLSAWRAHPANKGRGYVNYAYEPPEAQQREDEQNVKAAGIDIGMNALEGLGLYARVRDANKFSKIPPPLMEKISSASTLGKIINGAGWVLRKLPVLGVGLETTNRTALAARRNLPKLLSPREKSYGDMAVSAWDMTYQPFLEGTAASMSGGLSDRVLSWLPRSLGGTMEGETDEQYYYRTGRDLGHRLQRSVENYYTIGKSRPMTDEELYKYLNQRKIEPIPPL